MSREPPRKGYFSRDPRNRDRDWNRPDYRGRPLGRKSRSPIRGDHDRRRSRSPRKNEKDAIDDNILSEIAKLPEPSELWDSQFQDGGGGGYPPPPPSFPPQEGVGNPPYGSNYQPSYSRIYDDFPPVAAVPPTPLPPDMTPWNQMSLPPPPPAAAPQPPFVPNPEDQLKKEAAIESEMRHQKAALSKQREDYMKKASILKKELDTLKDQRNELRGDSKRSPSPDTKRFLKENTKLQLEIQNKLKTINNVVDMLNGIIGEDAPAELPIPSDESPDRSSKRKSRSPSVNQKFNYVYYDPEMHWCRVCNEFPPTAKDYLNHLHSPAHHKMAAAHMEAPWHGVTNINEGFPNNPSAPTKRTPIKGLQFFVPSTAWYCKLCDQFIGDLHCASAHLKSVTHSKNYTNFVEQNPHWETDWMSDRQKSFEKARASAKNKPEDKTVYTAHTITFNKDGFHTKRKESPPPQEESKKKKEKKKKKKKSRSSSSSSSSSSSDSEPSKKKKKKKDKKGEPDDKALSEWMSAIQRDRLNENDRKILDTLKNRMKMDKPEEKRRSPERRDDVKRRESELRESRTRETRDRDRERDRERERERERRAESRRREDDRRRSSRSRQRSVSPRNEPKKPEIRKMPFIGKMPVYKHLGKNKNEDQKKEDEKKKEEDEASKKRREEMDAEIQKKVAEFKEKIAKAQLERQQQAVDIPPPAIALPTTLGGTVPALPPTPAPAPAPPPPAAAPPALPKDFQDALDIIFPTEVKPDLSQTDIFGNMAGLASGFMGQMGLGSVMPTFPPFLQPQMPPQMMMGFDLNPNIFQPRTQLYDTQVPLVPNSKPKYNKNKMNNNKKPYGKNNRNKSYNNQKNQAQKTQDNKEGGEAAKKQEEMDDLAMLGIDASDVGAGI